MNALILRDDADNGVCTLTLNSEDNRNALSKRMLETLLENIETASNDPAVRVVIIKAHGPAFCAGHDLREINAHREDPEHGVSFF
jgi:Enoyl-CoA hydratase/carnithine racemase